jgi:hypothetical protein
VADEIRLLAERSTESTKRIATLVKSIQGDTYEAVVAMEDSTQEVVKGSQLADDAGRSLNSIYTAVERQAQMIEGIARSANDQTTVSEAVAVAMSRISEITRQTDAGTQEAAVSVSYLAELSEQLRASVSTFRLPDRANEGLGSYSGSGSLVEDRPGGADNQLFTMTPALSGAPGEAHQPVEAFSGAGFDFGSLPELGNGGSFLPVPSREGRGQYEFAASAPMNMNSISSVGNAEELPTEFANERLKQPALPQSGIGQWANLPHRAWGSNRDSHTPGSDTGRICPHQESGNSQRCRNRGLGNGRICHHRAWDSSRDSHNQGLDNSSRDSHNQGSGNGQTRTRGLVCLPIHQVGRLLGVQACSQVRRSRVCQVDQLVPVGRIRAQGRVSGTDTHD